MDLFLVGAGYVGLTSAVGLAQLGHVVVVHDIDAARIRALEAGHSPLFEDGLEAALGDGVAAGRLRFTSDPRPPESTQVAVVCVPTPLGPDGLLSTAIVEDVVRGLRTALPSDRVVAVRSTLPLHGPERLAALAAEQPRGAPIVVNPEFMREGHALADFMAPSRIVVGYLDVQERPAAEAVAAMYQHLPAPVLIADARSVVLIKLASNVFLGMKIAFADELARLCDMTGADVETVADGLGMDQRIGRSFLTPGPGFGGSCLPEQAEAIAVETRSRQLDAPLLGSIALSNRTHMDQIVATLGRLLPNGLDGARIGVLGLAFKANTDDVRESPALTIARLLRDQGAHVAAFDPVAMDTAVRADPSLSVVPSVEAAADQADALIVLTEWREFRTLPWADLARGMRGDLVYDARRIVDGRAVQDAGLRYVPLGSAAVWERPGDDAGAKAAEVARP